MATRALLTPALLTALALGLFGGCKDETATVVLVTVTGKAGMPAPPVTMDVQFSHGGEDFLNIFGAENAPVTLPATLVIRADGRTGPAQIVVRAKARLYNSNELTLVGEGEATTELVVDGQADVALELRPADFPVNESTFVSQTFSYAGPSGRQLDSDTMGNFVVVWVDETCPLSRCDVWYRLFDSDAKPRLNGMTNSTKEYQANKDNAVYDMPTVAVQESGGFVMAWQRLDATYEIRSRAFEANGAPDATSGGDEIPLSDAAAITPSDPDIAALKDTNYFVVWSERNTADDGWRVMGRFLGPHGRPTKDASGMNEPLEIASFTGASNNEPEPAVAPRNDPNNAGFLVVWKQGVELWGRAYTAQAAPITSTPFSICASCSVSRFNVGAMANAYAVIWSDSTDCGADEEGTCIRLRRYDLNGAPQEEAWTVNTNFAGNQVEPTISRLRTDGSLLAVWSTDTDPEDFDGGIRGRPILSNGLPVGEELRVNTTLPKEQTQPGVAPFVDNGFIVVFRDMSMLEPDTDPAGIRGRAFFPVYDPRDGQIGALCDQGESCAEGLSCQQTNVGKRCISTCAGPGDPCPNGGKCRELSAGGSVCEYRL